MKKEENVKSQPKKPVNTLLNFFAKKPGNSVKIEENVPENNQTEISAPVEEKKSLFKCLGSKSCKIFP